MRMMPTVNEVPVESVFVGAGREIRFDPKNRKDACIIESEKRSGLVNPVDVRAVNGQYELITGRRRLLAALALGWRTITVRVDDWSDREIGFLATTEAVCRQGMTPGEEVRAIRTLMSEYERLFPTSDGRKPFGNLISYCDHTGRLRVRGDMKLSAAFSENQLAALAQREGITRNDLKAIAGIVDAERRGVAVYRVCRGVPVAEAVRRAETSF
jgi:hypothetical protein